MPFAPRLARKRSGFSDDGANVSRSRTGIDELTQTVAPPGRLRTRAAHTAGSTRSAGAAPSASGTSASASRHSRSHASSVCEPAISPASDSSNNRGAASTKVPAVRVGSFHERVGSTTICGASASQARNGFEVGVSPTRKTSSGTCAAAQCSARSSTS